jgi:hypothetical protein
MQPSFPGDKFMKRFPRLSALAVIGFSFLLITIAFSQAPREAPSLMREMATETPAPPKFEKANGAAKNFCKCIGETDSPVTTKIEQTLQRPLHAAGFEFSKKPLQAVAKELQDEYGIPIQIDQIALESVGVRTHEPVTISLRGISLRSALRHMLNNLLLTYTIRDEVLIITTPDEAEKQFSLCVYDVRDLLDPRDADSLAIFTKTIEDVINVGGPFDSDEPGIWPIKPGTLIAVFTPPRQEELRDLLSAIREMNREPPKK